MTDPIEIAVALLIGMSSVGVLSVAGAVAWGLIRRWDRPRPAMTEAEAEKLRTAVDHLAGEVSDLHERLDFTERVLASQRDSGRLGGGDA
jgi:hypothetical protein